MPEQPPKFARATLTAPPGGSPLTVQFNPASLVYSVENGVPQQSGGPTKVQYVAQFSGKLTMDLQFDTTDTGSDVRSITNKVALMMQPVGSAQPAGANTAPPSGSGGTQSSPAKAPPAVVFAWGSYSFQGVMDTFKQTVDFFSADGIALRALVSIGLSQQNLTLNPGGDLAPFALPPQPPAQVPSSSADSALSVATRGGDPSAARQLGADNGLDSLRFTGGATLQVSAGGVQLNPPAAFVTPPPVSGGIGLSLGISVGAQAGLSVQAGVSVQAGASVQVNGLGASFGAGASAGVPATAGAFAGLQSGRARVSSTANLNPMQMLPSTVSTDVSTFDGASFSLGGAANSTGSPGMSTDVGAQFNFSDRLTFSSDD